MAHCRSKHTFKADQKSFYRVVDHLFLVLEDWRFVNVFANAVIEDSAVKHPRHLKLSRGRLILRWQSRFVATFPDDAGQNLVPHGVHIPAVDIEPLQTRIQIDAKPFASEDDIRISVIEFLQSSADWTRAIG